MSLLNNLISKSLSARPASKLTNMGDTMKRKRSPSPPPSVPQKQVDADQETHNGKKHEDNTEASPGVKQVKTDSEEVEEEEEEDKTPDIHVQRALRALGQPIKLFAENKKDRLTRLKLHERNKERLGDKVNTHNEYRKSVQNAEQNSIQHQLKQQPHTISPSKGGLTNGSKHESDKHDPRKTTEPENFTLSMKEWEETPDVVWPKIVKYLKNLMAIWEQSLEERTDEEKQSAEGKKYYALQRQSTENMKPFFRQLKKKTLPLDIVPRILEICIAIQKRDYIAGNDAYWRMSIGNAPWPIGVTMVGIHERSAREKIHASQVAHVLNDESARKWIQGLKRLMTFSEKKFPPYDLALSFTASV